MPGVGQLCQQYVLGDQDRTHPGGAAVGIHADQHRLGTGDQPVREELRRASQPDTACRIRSHRRIVERRWPRVADAAPGVGAE
jgi:hypothetical protein